MKTLISCSCGQVPSLAEARFRLRYRTDPPAHCIGKDQIRALRDQTKPPVYDILNAIVLSRDRFAFYMEWDDNKVTTQYDLLKGKELI